MCGILYKSDHVIISDVSRFGILANGVPAVNLVKRHKYVFEVQLEPVDPRESIYFILRLATWDKSCGQTDSPSL